MSKVFCPSLRCRLPVLLGLFQGGANQLYSIFPLFRDMQVMWLEGQGLLLSFTKLDGLSAILTGQLLHPVGLSRAGVCAPPPRWLGSPQPPLWFAAVAVLISVGATLGRTGPFQLLLLALCEISFCVACKWMVRAHLKVTYVGGTIPLPVFTCYFGVVVSAIPSYQSNLLSLVGTMFLWIFWLIFVAARAQPGDASAATFSFLSIHSSLPDGP
uniref:Uncharacterized protein n=1 Tax=Chrysemys picta bellii TaxID=8478 RepID=A0A8C3HKN0_CHRPI